MSQTKFTHRHTHTQRHKTVSIVLIDTKIINAIESGESIVHVNKHVVASIIDFKE